MMPPLPPSPRTLTRSTLLPRRSSRQKSLHRSPASVRKSSTNPFSERTRNVLFCFPSSITRYATRLAPSLTR